MEHEKHTGSLNEYLIPAAIVIAAAALAGAWVYTGGIQTTEGAYTPFTDIDSTTLEEEVIPSRGVTLPVRWGDLGKQLVQTGVIDDTKFRALYGTRGEFTDEYEILLSGEADTNITITRENAGYVLNLLWALGLANKNPILEDRTEMENPAYGGAGNFASTGGWTVSKGDPMEHYGAHRFVTLTTKQQALVDKISRGIYRPCCGNSTHFPDCNHGMAMLGLLELMASQGVSEKDMWRVALAVNSYWFPDTYLTIATYMKQNGIEWKNADPEEMLGIEYSSASGFPRIAEQVKVQGRQRSAGGCGV